MSKNLADYIIAIPDFPEEGVIFRDVTSILNSAEGFRLAIDELKKLLDGVEFDAIAGIEARGFLFGAPLAYIFNKPFVAVRKKGKLPRETIEKTYALEYGTATIEIHKTDVTPGQRVVIVDDLIATGGSLKAACELIEEAGAVVAKILVPIELKGLNGRETLKGYDVASVVAYEGK